MKKRLLSILLMLAMVITMLPFAAGAADVAEETTLTADDLYVKENLVFQLDGSDASTIDIANKKWYNKVDNGATFATLSDSGNYWKAVDGGISYTFTSLNEVINKRNSVGMLFPTSVMVEGDMTVEYVYAPTGLFDAAGNKIYQPDTSTGKYGIYNGGRSSFSFAGIQLCHFQPSATDTGNKGRTRMFYSPSQWESGDLPSGGTYTDAMLFCADMYSYDLAQRTLVFVRDREGSNLSMSIFMDSIQKASLKNSGNNRAIQNADYTIAQLETYAPKAWSAFFGVPATVYSVRMYTRALTTAELNQNHFADLAKFFDLDLSALSSMSEVGREALYNAMARVSFAEEKEVVESMVAEAELLARLATDAESFQTEYDALYVQDGLTVLLSAFEADETLMLDKSMWYSKVGGGASNYATLSAGAGKPWKLRENGGVGYDLTIAQMSSSPDNFLDLTGHLPSGGNFTVEKVAKMHYASENGVRLSGNYAHNTDIVAERMGVCGTWFFQGSLSNVSARYIFNTATANWGHGSGWVGGEVKSAAHWNAKDNIQTNTDIIATNGNTTSRTIFVNGKQALSYSHATVNLNFNLFWLARSNACTFYAVRVYDRHLTTGEMNRNRTIDMFAYFGLDVAPLAGCAETIISLVADSCSFLTYESGAADLEKAQAIIDEAGEMQAELEAAHASYNEYDDLYVKDGLNVLLSAFDANSVNAERGVWYNKIGDTYAMLTGGKWTTEAAQGGLSYTMTKADWDADAQKGSYGINMGAMNLPSEDYTVELVQILTGLTNEDGTRYVDGTAKWGVYGSGHAAYEIGAMKGTAFVCNSSTTTAGSGQSCVRISYHNGYWGSDNGKYWLTGDWIDFMDAKYATLPVAVSFTGKVDTFDRNNDKIYQGVNTNSGALTGVPAHKVSLKGYEMTFSVAGTTITHNTVLDEVRNGYLRPFETTLNGVKATGYEAFLQAGETYLQNGVGNGFWLMRNLPGTVYTVRVYDRVLTAEEKAQNHFADLAAFFGLDVSMLELLYDAELAILYAQFADYGFDADGEKLETELYATICAMAGTEVVNSLESITVFPDTDGYEDFYGTSRYDLCLGALAMMDGSALGELTAAGYTVELGSVFAPLVDEMTEADITVVRGETAFTSAVANSKIFVAYSNVEDSSFVTSANMALVMESGVMFEGLLSYVADIATRDYVDAPLNFRSFISITDADGNNFIYYDDIEGEKSLVEYADFYVNQYASQTGNKLDAYAHNQHPVLLEILGDEAEIIEIELAPTMGDKVTDEADVYAGDITEATMESVRETVRDDAVIEDANGEAAEDNVASQQVVKVRPVDDTTVAYTFTTEADGNVRVVIEYVARKYTLGNRTLTVQIDGYKAEVYEFTSADAATDVNNHAFLVIEFEVAAGEHTITLGAVEGTRSVDIYGVAITAN